MRDGRASTTLVIASAVGCTWLPLTLTVGVPVTPAALAASVTCCTHDLLSTIPDALAEARNVQPYRRAYLDQLVRR